MCMTWGPCGVGTRHCNMGTPVPKRYKSRRPTFYEEIQRFVGPQASYIRLLSKGSPPQYLGEQSDFIISETLTKYVQLGFSSSCSTYSESTEGGSVIVFSQGNIFQEMVRVTMSVRPDLLSIPGYTSKWHGHDQAHVDQVIQWCPDLFVRLLFGVITVVEEGIPVLKQTVYSVVQAIVFETSNKQKLHQRILGQVLNLFHTVLTVFHLERGLMLTI